MTYDWIRFVADVAEYVPGGMFTLGAALLLIAVIVGLAVQPAGVIRFRLAWRWPWRRHKRGEAQIIPATTTNTNEDTLDDTPVDEMIERARGYMARGEYRLAVREWLRVQVRELVDRGVVVNRPGMTVTELAQDGSAAMPELTSALTEAATLFSDIWYGGHDATARAATRMRDLTDQVLSTAPHHPAPIVITVEAQ